MMGTFTFLGTGTSQGVPMPACSCHVCHSKDPRDKRLRSSGLIRLADLTLCIDAGPDFRYQMLREKVNTLNAIVFTHEHRDHIAGIDDIRAYNYINNQVMPLFAPKEVVEALHQSYPYIFNSNYPGIPKVVLNEISEESFNIEGLTLTPIPVWHHKLRVFGYRFGDLAYITDAKTVPDYSRKLIRNIPTLIINCLHESPHISHFNLSEALTFVADINPGITYLTHISHLFGTHEEISAKLPPNVHAAYDGLALSFNTHVSDNL